MNWLIDDYIDDIKAAMERWIYHHSLEWALQYEIDSVYESWPINWLIENCPHESSFDCTCNVPELSEDEAEDIVRESYADWACMFGIPDLADAMNASLSDFECSEDCPWETLAVFTRAIHLQHVHGSIVDHCRRLTYELVDNISQKGLEQTFGKREVARFVREW